MNHERRSFISGLLCTVSGVFSWLTVGHRTEAHELPGYLIPRRPRPRKKRTEFIKTIGIGGNVVTCHDQETFDSWDEVRQQVEACRILRENPGILLDIPQTDSDEWDLGWYEVRAADGPASSCRISTEEYNDPVDALIAAEPLYLKWKSDRHGSGISSDAAAAFERNIQERAAKAKRAKETGLPNGMTEDDERSWSMGSF